MEVNGISASAGGGRREAGDFLGHRLQPEVSSLRSAPGGPKLPGTNGT